MGRGRNGCRNHIGELPDDEIDVIRAFLRKMISNRFRANIESYVDVCFDRLEGKKMYIGDELHVNFKFDISWDVLNSFLEYYREKFLRNKKLIEGNRKLIEVK